MTHKKVTTIKGFWEEFYYRFHHDEVVGLAAQLAYFFLLSLFPFLIFLITLIGYLPISQVDVLGIVSEYAPGQTMHLIETTLNEIMDKQRGGLLSFGVIATIWSASNGINAIIRAMNRAYDVKENRSFIVSRLMAIVLTIAMIIVIIVALLLPVFGKAIGIFIFTNLGLSESFLSVWNVMRIIISFFIMVIVLAALYRFAPNIRLTMREVWIGALFATVGWQIVSLAFSYFVTNFGNYSATYGSLGGIIILLIWFYLSAMVIVIGGEINAMIKLNGLHFHK
ncbi:YihY/virulence factor BrkB family protein [Bacillus sp. Marseille-P3661]|uniref:YihY/virulence factor BrkB family protein n=1 Tax=Bacillus sp. Marseille-P3661 TaxID=1936234 RepID=UPI000C8168F0|nr:YihY/virulence factor BrkB family protein [Bacillus sp. Marseille-P3661]